MSTTCCNINGSKTACKHIKTLGRGYIKIMKIAFKKKSMWDVEGRDTKCSGLLEIINRGQALGKKQVRIV